VSSLSFVSTLSVLSTEQLSLGLPPAGLGRGEIDVLACDRRACSSWQRAERVRSLAGRSLREWRCTAACVSQRRLPPQPSMITTASLGC
jgi:hypothetical protein